jgi:hypothetical protein
VNFLGLEKNGKFAAGNFCRFPEKLPNLNGKFILTKISN